MLRLLFTAWLAVSLCNTAMAANERRSKVIDPMTASIAEAMRESVGGPGRTDIGDVAHIEIPAQYIFIPPQQAAVVLRTAGHRVPADLAGVLFGPDGVEAMGIVRYVKTGFTEADSAIAWTPDDILFSFDDTIEADNRHLKAGGTAMQIRRWVVEPRYEPETHHMFWSPLIVPKSEPAGAEGAITLRGAAFGRYGYIQIAIRTSVEGADTNLQVVQDFIGSVQFLPGKGYADAVAADPRAPGGLASVFGITALHKYRPPSGLSTLSNLWVPIAGGGIALVALIGGGIMYIRYRRELTQRS